MRIPLAHSSLHNNFMFHCNKKVTQQKLLHFMYLIRINYCGINFCDTYFCESWSFEKNCDTYFYESWSSEKNCDTYICEL